MADSSGRFGSPEDFRDDLGRVARQIRRERDAAARTVEPLLRRTPADQWPGLVEHPDLLTCGALERLSTILNRALTARPKDAEAIARLAVSLAEAIPETSYPALIHAQVKAIAWKDLGKTHGFLARYEESLDALAHAESLVEGFAPLGYDLAIIRFNRALTLQEMDRHEESFVLFSACKQTFRAHGDTRLLVVCGFAEGVLLKRLQHYRQARETYLLLLASTLDIDTETRAAIHRAIGDCSIELGDYDDAEANLIRSIALNREIGQPVEALKGETLRGRLLLRKGSAATALTHLRPIRRELLRHTLNEEAGLSGLEMVAAYLVLDRPVDAENLARTIVKQFRAASLNARAATAVAYLSEAIAARKATIALVNDVLQYVLLLHRRPEQEFAPSEATGEVP